MRTLYSNATIVNEGHIFNGWLLTDSERIAAMGEGDAPAGLEADSIRDCSGLYLLPGVIDVHVHFRDPGLTEKGDIATESHAAVAGRVLGISK